MTADTTELATLTLEQRTDGIALLSLRRPERLNAISLRLVDDLHDVLDQLDRDLATRAVVLHGVGRAFCAGTDLKEGLDVWPEDVGPVQGRYRLQQRVSELVVRLREIPQPVIAAVHGAAAGGGLSLACAADVRIADVTARFNAAFTRIGLSGGDLGASWFLPRLVGMSHAAEIMYTGRFVDAEQALAVGLVSRVVAEGQHVPTAIELATEMLVNPPLSIRMTKELLNASLDAPSLRQTLELENRTQILCTLTGDFDEGAAAFTERREPRFHDR